MDTILAVDSDIAVSEQIRAEWAKVGIDVLRVDTMHDAITRLIRGDAYLFVGINEDSTPDFCHQLPMMRDVTDFPIFVVPSSYRAEKKIKAIDLGADVYDPFSDQISENVHGGLTLLKARSRWTAKRPAKMPLLIGGDVILSPSRRTVFVKNTEVKLQKKEFELLRLLMANSGVFMEPSKLLRKVWGEEYSENGGGNLRKTISRLRTKLAKASAEKEHIKVERDVGYKFLS